MDNPSSPNLQHAKSILRRYVRAEVKKLSPETRQSLSLQLSSLLEQQEIWKRAHSILFYAPLPDEPDIWKLVEDSLAAEKTVLLPRFHPEHGRYLACHIKDISRDVSIGQYGI